MGKAPKMGKSRRSGTFFLALIGLLLLGLNPQPSDGQSCEFKQRDGEGSMSSPYYPTNYQNGQSCQEVVEVAEGYGVKFTFSEAFGFESSSSCDYDYVQFTRIDNITGEDSPQSKRFCGDKKPEPYVFPGSKVKINFRSDNSNTNTGFSMTWAKVAIPCGSVLNGPSGALRYVPHKHHASGGDRSSCSWIISAPYGRAVRLEFESAFNLGVGENSSCSEDSIQVVDMIQPDRNDTIISSQGNSNSRGRWCGSSRPPVITSIGQHMLVTFHSAGEEEVETRFAFTWDTVTDCGGTLASPEGQLMSYFYQEGSQGATLVSPNFHNCSWDILVPETRDILLSFDNQMDANDCGTLSLLEFSEEEGEFLPLPDWCADNATDGSPQKQFRSSSKKIRIGYYFAPSPTVTWPGFRVSWNLACGRRVFERTGTISTPGYGTSPYSVNEECEWIIQGRDGYTVRLDFQSAFDIEASNNGECSYDYVEVLEASSETLDTASDLRSLGRYCGTLTPPPLTSSTNTMVVRLHSDSSKTGLGFKASWDSACGRVYGDLQGSITSPNYPSSYPQNFDCRWEIQVPQDYSIRLSFNKPFHLELAGGCEADYLEVYDYTTSGDLSKRGRWCGRELPPLQTSLTSRLLLVFHSDDVKNRVGFQAEWTSVNKSGFDCGEQFHSPDGTFTSPGFPQPYPADVTCRWEIQAPKGQRVKLDFGASTFDLESDREGCRYDGIEVLDTLPNGKMVSYGKWCSVREIPIFHSTSRLVVLFYSDSGKNGQGFQATWTSEPECGWPITGRSGHLVTPDYPSQYPENQECRWEISPEAEVPDGVAGNNYNNNVTLHFDPRFDLEAGDPDCVYDYVEIRRGDDVIGRWCGTNAPPDVTSGGKTMEVVFKSDKSVIGRGFLATLVNL